MYYKLECHNVWEEVDDRDRKRGEPGIVVTGGNSVDGNERFGVNNIRVSALLTQ